MCGIFDLKLEHINMNRTICILGFGYTAIFLAKNLLRSNFSITGTSRAPNNCKYYQEFGYKIVDFNNSEVDNILNLSTHLLILTPPDPVLGDPVLATFLLLLEKYRRQLEWVGYVSSTAVYGNHEGVWVDELTTPKNLGSRAALRLKTEIDWLNVANKFQLPIHIFRLAGIYGPSRNVLTDIVKGKKQSIYKEGHFFSRIHVEDIAKVILASIQKPNPGSIYNVADDFPAPSHELDQYAASLLHRVTLPLVPFEKAVLSDMAKEFYNNNRRVSNAKIKQEFKLELDYPCYRKGLMKLYQDSDY